MECANPLPKILIADDDLETLKLLEAGLRPIAATVLTAGDGEEALKKVLEEKPELVILDVMMPRLTGWEIAKYIRQHADLKGTKVLLVTGIGEKITAATSEVMGADDYLDKPFTFDALTTKVRKLLGIN